MRLANCVTEFVPIGTPVDVRIARIPRGNGMERRTSSPSVSALVLHLPEPPALNRMIDLAKRRTRRSRTGGWMKRSLPVVYDQEKEVYEATCLAAVRAARIQLPTAPWPRWAIDAVHFKLHGLRDPIELLAGLKWPVDFLVAQRIVDDDSPRELLHIPTPSQEIARANRGVQLVIHECP
jgi:hypothetical protein